MDEKKKSDATTDLEEDLKKWMAEEKTDTKADVEADAVEESDKETEEETVEETAEEIVEETVEETEEGSKDSTDDTSADEEDDTETSESEDEPKRFPLQKPIITAACIMLAAVICYLLFMGFLFKEPEGTTWSQDIDDTTYYYEFKNDNTVKIYLGSVEMTSTYYKSNSEGGKTITLGTTYANFYADYPATYEVTGSRLLGNQSMNYSYGEGYDFTLYQASRPKYVFETPKDFEAPKELIGTWTFSYYGYEIYKVTFNKNGTMVIEFVQDGVKYNGSYTVEDDKINFTFYLTENVVKPLEYSLDGDTLYFLGAAFVREGTESTADQAIMYPEG